MPPKIYAQRVPFEGPDEYNVMFVGEAPGQEEVGQGRPFIGKSGALLERYLNRLGLLRQQVMLANLCKYRPAENKFRILLGSSQLAEGIEELQAEIHRAKPNLIIGLGNWPLYILTGMCGLNNNKPVPGTGIMSYRGSRLQCKEEFGGGKFFATMHPSFVLRQWKWNPIFYLDLEHAIGEMGFPELNPPDYDEYIDPDADVLYDLLSESQNAEFISTDIETFRNQTFSCIGWAWNNGERDRAVTISFQRPDLWRFVKEMWECPTPKILQFGTYDHSFMNMFYSWRLGGYYDLAGWDTYVASASIYPDYPRGLDFLCSVHTKFPYYKDDRKVWRQTDDLNMLFRYNLKDVVGTMHVAYDQMRDIHSLFGAMS